MGNTKAKRHDKRHAVFFCKKGEKNYDRKCPLTLGLFCWEWIMIKSAKICCYNFRNYVGKIGILKNLYIFVLYFFSYHSLCNPLQSYIFCYFNPNHAQSAATTTLIIIGTIIFHIKFEYHFSFALIVVSAVSLLLWLLCPIVLLFILLWLPI